MVFWIVFQCYFIRNARCHRYGAQAGRPDQRIDLLFRKEVEELNEEDTARDGEGECKETSDHDTDRREVQECFGRHGRTDRQS